MHLKVYFKLVPGTANMTPRASLSMRVLRYLCVLELFLWSWGGEVTEMMGDQPAAKLSASADSNTFGAPIAAYAVHQVFADIWTRPGLDRRSRSLVSMSVMIAMRQPHEFAIHMGAGLNNGLTLKEIEELLIQALPYVGYPAIATALAPAAVVIKEHGLDVDENYAGHRGLL